MAPTLASGLTLSATYYVFSALARFTTKSFEVRGLPTLLEALKERVIEHDVKGKGRAIDSTPIVDTPDSIIPALRKRGLVTGQSRLLGDQDRS